MYLLSGAMSLHHLAIMTKPSLSCLLCFLCMLAIPIFPFFKFEEFLIYLSRLLFLILLVATWVYMYNYYPKPAHLPLLHPCPHCSSTLLVKKTNMASFVHVHTLLLHIEHHYCDDCIYTCDQGQKSLSLHHDSLLYTV